MKDIKKLYEKEFKVTPKQLGYEVWRIRKEKREYNEFGDAVKK
jgi:uncharacterized protein (DUF2249 family)